MTWWQRLRGQDRLERELDAELQFHVDRKIEDLVRAGVTAREARRRALLEFGGLDQMKEACRDSRGTRWVGETIRDIRFACRLFVRRRGPAATILITLAAALGLNATVFAIADAVALHPFTFPRLNELVLVTETQPDNPDTLMRFTSLPNFLDWRQQTKTIKPLAAFMLRDVELGDRPEPERLRAAFVSSNFFDAIAMPPAHGRAFLAGEETFDGAFHPVVLANGLWLRLFGGDPSIFGRSMVLDGERYQIVGIAPATLDFPFGTELWMPLKFTAAELANRENRTLLAVGRLAGGSTIEAAQSEMTVVGENLASRYPDVNARHGIRVQTLTSGMVEDGIRPLFAFLQASGLFVLLIACANVTNLLLALGVERQREVAVRVALGATRGQVARALWIESASLAALSVPLAIGVAALSLRAWTATMPARLAALVPGWHTIDVNGRVILFTATLALAAAVTFGVLPALRASHPSPDALKEAARGLTASAGRQRLRRGLIVAQMALVVPLLVAAGLSWRGTVRFLSGPQGYDPRGLLTLTLNLPERSYPNEQSERQFAGALLDQLAARGDIREAAVVNVLPSSGSNTFQRILVEGQPQSDLAQETDAVDFRVVSPSYFGVMSIPILKGRALADSDREGTERVAVISKSMAERYWPETDPLGRRFRDSEPADAPWTTVVGVSGDVIQDWFWGVNTPTMYHPYRQDPMRDLALVVRTDGDAGAVTSQVRNTIYAIAPDRPLLDVMTMEDIIRERLTAPRQIAQLLAVLGALALLLSAIGLYGVIAYVVSQRTHEIGLRLVLGATRGDVLGLVLRQAGRLTIAGVAIGTVFALGTSRIVEATLVGITSLDFPLLAGSAAVVAAVGLAAAYLPARRALTIDPVVALRNE